MSNELRVTGKHRKNTALRKGWLPILLIAVVAAFLTSCPGQLPPPPADEPGSGEPQDGPAQSADKDVTTFSFRAVDNGALTADVTASITATDIAATVPFGTNVTALVPTIETTGASVTPESGSAQNFTNPVTYTVTAADASARAYVVTVSIAPADSREIVSFSFTALDNAALTTDITASITATDVAATVPFGTNVTALVPTIETTGASVTPESGSAQNFTNPVTYTVTAADASTRAYVATVTVAAPSSDADLASLVISDCTLDPEFAPGSASYTASVASDISSITVTAVANHPNAEVTGDVGTVPLDVGGNTLTVLVTAEDQLTTKPYTIVVTRAAPVWQLVGSADFTPHPAASPNFVIGPGNVMYVAYDGSATPSRYAWVMTFDGTNWVDLGPGAVSAALAAKTSLAVRSDGVPYVVYYDPGVAGKATAMKFNGTGWDLVGPQGFTADRGNFPCLRFDSADAPHVAFADYSLADKATVMKFGGTSWASVGTAGFSAQPIVYGPSLSFDGADTPYVAFRDADPAVVDKATVMKLGETDWELVGAAGFSTGKIGRDIYLAIDGSDTPYVVYYDVTVAKIIVKKLVGTSWVDVGAGGAGFGDYARIAIDKNDVPHVAYLDYDSSSKATVRKFDGSSWVLVGAAGFSASSVFDVLIDFDSNNTPYVAYKSPATQKLTVMKLQ